MESTFHLKNALLPSKSLFSTKLPHEKLSFSKISTKKFGRLTEKRYLCTALNEGTEEFPLFFARTEALLHASTSSEVLEYRRGSTAVLSKKYWTGSGRRANAPAPLGQ